MTLLHPSHWRPAALLVLLLCGTLRAAPLPSLVEPGRPVADTTGLDLSEPTREKFRAWLDDIKQEAERLRKADQPVKAARYERLVKDFRARLEGAYPPPKREDAEVHVVGFYEGAKVPGQKAGKAEVQVTYTARPITLVLSAYNPIRWTVRLKEGVRLRQVLVAGYHTQEVTGLPDGTLVQYRVHEDRGDHDYFYAFRRQYREYLRMAGIVRRLAGSEVTTFQGTYRYKGNPVVVGPENERWRVEHLLWDLRPIHEEATRHRRERRWADMQRLRFRAVHAVRRGGRHASLARSFGDFTPTGPLTETLKPIPPQVQQVALTSDASQGYALAGNKVLRLDLKAGKQTTVPFDKRLPEVSWPSAVAYDAKRKRLLLNTFGGGGYLYAYDPGTRVWSVLRKPGLGVQALAYEPDEDVFYGVNIALGGEGDYKTLSKFSPDGNTLRQTALSEPIPAPHATGVQLLHLRNRLVLLIAPSTYEAEHEPARPRAYVIDKKTGKVGFRCLQQLPPPRPIAPEPVLPALKPVPTGEAAEKVPARIPLPRSLREPTLATFRARKADIEQEADRLRRAGDRERAAEYERRLRAFRDRLTGPYPEPERDDAEVHVVGIHVGAKVPGRRSGLAEVEVTYTARPITLVLCAYNPIRWVVRMKKGARLREVVVAGYHTQEVVGLPGKTPVRYRVHEGTGQRDYFYAERRGDEKYLRLTDIVRRLTWAEVTTFQGSYEYKSKPVVVGPENPRWRIDHLLWDLDPCHEEVTRRRRERLWEDVHRLRFRAVFLDGKKDGRPFLADCTPAGPLADTLSPLAPWVRQFAIDPDGPTHYTFVGRNFGTLDPKTGKLTPIAVNARLPQPRLPSAITFDSRRKRVLLNCPGREGHLYAFEPRTGKWSLVCSPGLDLHALAYSAEEDLLYGANLDVYPEQRLTALSVFNPQGAFLRELRLSEPIPRGDSVQLVRVRGYLVLLMSPSSREGHPLIDTSRAYVINPRTGEVVFSCVHRR
jgi:hypothetical protein